LQSILIIIRKLGIRGEPTCSPMIHLSVSLCCGQLSASQRSPQSLGQGSLDGRMAQQRAR
jgi:hypothetical protein